MSKIPTILHFNKTHRCMTILVEKSVPFDLRMLRSFRCLRPLKMVSKVPSKLVCWDSFWLSVQSHCWVSMTKESASSFGYYGITTVNFWWLTSYSKTHFLTVIVFTKYLNPNFVHPYSNVENLQKMLSILQHLMLV